MQSFDELLKNTLNSLKSSVESNEIIGKPIIGSDGSVILPVSKISIGYVLGGVDVGKSKEPSNISGGGISVSPIGFLICGLQNKFVRVDGEDNKWMDLAKSVVNVLKKD